VLAGGRVGLLFHLSRRCRRSIVNSPRHPSPHLSPHQCAHHLCERMTEAACPAWHGGKHEFEAFLPMPGPSRAFALPISFPGAVISSWSP